MNNHLSAEPEIGVWENREKLPKVPLRFVLIAAAACLISALALPLSFLSQNAALAFLALLFACVVILVRVPVSVGFVLAGAFLIATLTQDFTLAAFFLAMVVGIASGSLLFTTQRYPFLPLLLPLVGAAVSFFFVPHWWMCLLSVAFLPAAIFLAVATRTERPRTGAIAFTLSALLLTAIGAFLAWVWVEEGSLGRESLLGFVESFREDLITALLGARDELLQIALEDNGEQAQALYKQISELFTDAFIRESVEQTFSLVPAFAVIVCSVIAYEAQFVLNASYRTVGLTCVLTKNAQVFMVSVFAAIGYALSFLLMIFLPQGSVAFTVTQNVTLMLLPALCVMGFYGLMPLLARSRGGMRMFLLFAIFGLLCCSTGSVLFILGMWGAYTTIVVAIQKKRIEQMIRNGENPFANIPREQETPQDESAPDLYEEDTDGEDLEEDTEEDDASDLENTEDESKKNENRDDEGRE